MTRRPSDIPLERTTLNLFAGDMARLQSLVAPEPASVFIRALIRRYIERLEREHARTRSPND